MRKILLAIVVLLLFTAQAAGYVCVKTRHWVSPLGAVTRYYVLQSDSDKWWKDEMQKVEKLLSKDDSINWLYLVDGIRQVVVVGKGNTFIQLLKNDNYASEVILPIKLSQFGCVYKGKRNEMYLWGNAKYSGPYVALFKGKQLRREYIHKDSRKTVYYAEFGNVSFMLYRPKKNDFVYFYAQYYPEYDVTLIQEFYCSKYCIDAFDKVIADAKRRGIILK